MHAINDKAWQERLYDLCNRFSHIGMGADLASLSKIELWGLYLNLSRRAEDE
jgi:hypothetical protein